MATVTAVKNGNWSDTTVWSTGALPTTADDVESGVYTVQMDVSATVLSVKNTAGGTFNLLGGVTITATSAANGFFGMTTNTSPAVPLITFNQASPAIAGLNGNIRINQFGYGVISSGTGTLNITGNIYGAWNNNQNNTNYCAVLKSGNGIVNITSSTIGLRSSGSYNNGPTIIVDSTATAGSVNITATTITDGVSGDSTKSAIIQRSTGCPINVTGTVTSTTSASNSTLNSILIQAGTVNLLSGSAVTGATNSNNYTIQISSSLGTSVLNVTGNVTGGTFAGPTIYGNGTINVTGAVTAGSGGAAIGSTNVLAIDGPIQATANSAAATAITAYVSGPLIGASNGTAALLTYFMTWHPTSTPATYMTAVTSDVFGNATGYRNLYTADYGQTGHPTAGNVRLGTVYGPSNEIIGTMAVPLPSQVIAGVAVDVPPTVGSASLDPSALWNIQLSTLTVPGSIGERLKNLITTDIVATQLKNAISYNG